LGDFLVVHAVYHDAVEDVGRAGYDGVAEAFCEFAFAAGAKGEVVVDGDGADLDDHGGFVVGLPVGF